MSVTISSIFPQYYRMNMEYVSDHEQSCFYRGMEAQLTIGTYYLRGTKK